MLNLMGGSFISMNEAQNVNNIFSRWVSRMQMAYYVNHILIMVNIIV